MKNFRRALGLALQHRWTVVACVGCSLMVALFWGANIGSLYPVVEAVFRGDSLPAWVEKEVEQGVHKVAELQQQVRQLQAESQASQDPGQQRELDRQTALVQAKLGAEQRALETVRWLQPAINRNLPHDPFQTLVVVVVFVLAGTLIKDLFLVANNLLVARLGQLATLELRKEFFRRTLQLELSAFGEGHTSKLMSRFTGDIGAITTGVTTVFGKSLLEPLKMAACIAGAAVISWRLLLLSMLITPLAFFLLYRLGQSIKRANRRVMEEMAQFFSRLSESFSGIQVVKAYTMERYERSRYLQIVKELYRKAMRTELYNSLTRLNTEVLGMCIVCLAMLAGGYLVLSQETHLLGIRMTYRPLSFGSMMVFYAFLIGISDPVRKLSDVFNTVQKAVAAAERVYPLLDREPTIRDPERPRELPSPHAELIFDHVQFHYQEGRPVLRDVCLRIRHGETVALVGPNGCGKSTLLNLIPRFYDPTSGEVRLDYVNLRDVRMRDLRLQIGLVTQHTLLFDDTIMDNIRYGSPHAKDEQVIEAARQAHAHHFITTCLEHGYQTQVGERGGRLSGGQRQRIALAQAILRDPQIMLLDEATSQIDPESEQLIHKALSEFIRGRTTLMITHRASTLALADRIVVMDEGRIEDQGTHQQLLQRCSLYQRLYQSEFRESA
ncbi:MAG: ABC transporter ATP-binding protein [Pirellulaceae bacterium]|nr:ABC transporter ATP-binding protein [Pirellulaceae bacterium]